MRTFTVLLLPGLIALLLIRPCRALDRAVFYQGAQRLQAHVQQDLEAQDLSRPAALYLRPGSQSRLALLQPEQARGTVLLLHGYSAGPWQVADFCKQLNAAGFHCYAPRLPGHGWIRPDRSRTGERLVTSDQTERYEAFLEQIYSESQALQVPVMSLGLSGGANLALRLAQKHDMLRTVAIAPLLGPDHPAAWNWRLAEGLHNLGPLSGLLSALPDRLLGWPNLPESPKQPVTHGNLNQALTIYRLGRALGPIASAVQLISSPADPLSGLGPVNELFLQLGGPARHGWYHSAGTPAVQGLSSQALQTVTMHFLKTGERFMRPPEGF